MYIQKNFSLIGILSFSWRHIVWLSVWSALVAFLKVNGWLGDLTIPWLPLSVIGTAVAFYIGFKNNQAYDRLWEARKIWGGIVNNSRMWGSMVKAYLVKPADDQKIPKGDLDTQKQKLIFRHIAWLYVLRDQLLIPTSWEHISQSKHIARVTRMRRKKSGIGTLGENITEDQMNKYLGNEELNRLINYKNSATQIIDQQAQDLQSLRLDGLIDDFRHMELQNILNEFYTLQGKCERIKKFPLPRQYGSMSFIFVAIFIFLLPFGMVSEFDKLGDWGAWLSVPFTIIIGWVYLMMELVGDYSENPFEGLGNDIPMLSLCRVIEIDLLEMLGETDLPPAIEPKNGVLM